MTDEDTRKAISTWAAVGRKVRVRGTEHVADVVAHLSQSHYLGGVVIEPPQDGFFRHWNVDALEPMETP